MNIQYIKIRIGVSFFDTTDIKTANNKQSNKLSALYRNMIQGSSTFVPILSKQSRYEDNRRT